MCNDVSSERRHNGSSFFEREVYKFLEKLGDSYVIFHSVQWMKRGDKWKSKRKENDFFILHRKLGALVLEVKCGDVVYRDGAFNQATNEVHILSERKAMILML